MSGTEEVRRGLGEGEGTETRRLQKKVSRLVWDSEGREWELGQAGGRSITVVKG